MLETTAPRYQFKPEHFHKAGNGVVIPQPLERQDPTWSGSPLSEPPPIYQDVADCLSMRNPPTTTTMERPNGTVNVLGFQEDSIAYQEEKEDTKVDSQYSDIAPVYQEIVSGSSSVRALTKPHDKVNHMPVAGTNV